MKIAIVAAMREELAPFRQRLGMTNVVFKQGKTVIEQVCDQLYLVESGIGKANAAATSAWLCHIVQPDVIINTGSTGSFVRDVALGDVVVSTDFRYSDVDATGFDYEWGQVPQMPAHYPVEAQWLERVRAHFAATETRYQVHYGQIATSDSFMSDVATTSAIQAKLPHIVASDMESAAIAQIAASYRIPVLNIRGISDYVGEEATVLFKESLALASENAFDAVWQLTEQLVK